MATDCTKPTLPVHDLCGCPWEKNPLRMNINRINKLMRPVLPHMRTAVTWTYHYPGHDNPHTIQTGPKKTKPSDSST